MTRMARVMVALGLAACALLVDASRAAAVTTDEIVQLTKAGIADPVILALIDRDRSVFTIDAEQIVALKKQGVSDAVVLAMLKSGRETDAEMRAESAASGAALLAALAAPPPELVVVGHGPEIPNDPRQFGLNYSATYAGVVTMPAPIPYVSPYAAAIVVASAPCRTRRGATTTCAPPLKVRPIR